MENKENTFVEETIKTELFFRYSLRAYFSRIMVFLFLTIYSLFLNDKLAKKKVFFGHLCHQNIITPYIIFLSICIFLMIYKIFKFNKNVGLATSVIIFVAAMFVYLNQGFMIPHNILENFLKGTAVFGGLGFLYYIAYAKSSYITANARFIEINEGIFSRSRNNTNMTDIADHDMNRGPIDILLNLSKIKIELRRSGRETFVISELTSGDASELFDFIKAHAYGTYREFIIDEKRRKGKEKKQKEDPSVNPDIDADGEGDPDA